MANDLNLKLTLSADGKQLSGSLKAAQGEVNNFAIKADHAGTKAAGSFGKARQGVESISKQLEVAQNRLVQFAMAGGVLSTLHSVIKVADDYGEMAERIRMATTSATDYEQVQKRLQETAGGTYRALSEAQELYIQTADALRSLGYNTEQQLDITDSLSYSFVTNATSAEKASGAINAFSRSIQTGKVSALDWQSLLMATPTLVNDIASATGKTTSEIRSLGIQGKLGLGELTEGLRLARDENQALADDMNTTVSDAITRLRGNFSVYLGELNQTHNATYGLADGIATLAENIDGVMTVVLVAGATAAARYTLSIVASTVASVQNTIAQRAAAAQELQLAQAHAASTKLALAHAAANRGLMGSHAAAAQAATAHEAAVKRLAVAQNTTAAGGRALLGVLGGPVGLAVTAAAVAVSFIDWGKSARDAAAGSDLLKQSVDGLTAAQARQRLQQMEGGFKQAQADVVQLTSKVKAYKVMLETVNDQKSKNLWSEQLIEAAGNLDTAKQKLEEYSQIQQRLNDIMSERVEIDTPSFADPEAEKAIAGIFDGLQQQYLQLSLNEEQYLRYKMAVAGASLEEINSATALHQTTAALKEQQKAQEAAAAATKAATKEQEDWIKQAVGAIDPARELDAEIEKLQTAMSEGLFGDLSADKFNKYIDDLKKKLSELNSVKIEDPAARLGGAMQTAAGGLRDVAGAMQGMHEQGTRGYQEMAVAMQAINVLSAVGAVLEQGKGDPYTAFARMAAMAAAVAGLGVQVSMMGGGWSDDAAIQQAAQGTGTVLGDSAAKSESIAHAVDITAAATSQLVGINRDMLRALQAMQAGITGATVRIAQGAKNVDFGTTYKPSNAFDLTSNLGQDVYSVPGLKQFDQISLGVMSGAFKAVGKMLGGSSKVTDQGIQIIGGSLGELMEDVVVNSYQVTKSKKYKWSSSKTRTDYQGLGNDVSDQFSLVFESLADSVYAGAVALGLSGAEVERQINEYTIATQKISTKGLSAEEQQKEIEAVFSSIFDGLAGSVVTFLPEFQQAGEGLGETLARVATNVQVTEEAVARLGFQAERLGAEQFAELSILLVEAAGGLEQFISGMSSFIDKFASDEHKFKLAASDMQRALAQVGLAVPDTREGMWNLMQSLDASTESGRSQIAALLNLTDVSDAYYKALEKQAETEAKLTAQRLAFSNNLERELNRLDMSGLERSLDDLNKWYTEQIKAAEELGAETVFLERLYARKRADAIEAELEAINQNTDSQLEQLKAEHARAVDAMVAEYQRLVESIHAASASVADAILNIQRQGAGWNEVGYQSGVITDLRGQLGQGSIDDQVGIINQLQGAISARYQAEIQASQAAAQAAQQQHQAAQQAAQQRYQAELQAVKAMQQAVQKLHDAADALLLSAASPELLGTQLTEAQRQFSSLSSAAQRGDVEAAGKLQSVGSSYLNIAKDYYAQGSDEYAAIFREIESAYRSVAAPAEPVAPPVAPEVLYYQEQDAALQQKAIAELTELQSLLADLEEQAAAEHAAQLAKAEAEQARQHAELLERHREQVNAVNESANRIVAAINAQTAAVDRQSQESERQNNELKKELARMRSELARTQEMANAAKRAV